MLGDAARAADRNIPPLAVLSTHVQVTRLKVAENTSRPRGTKNTTVNGVVTGIAVDATTAATVRGNTYKHRSTKGEDGVDKGNKLIRMGCYSCEGPYKSKDCPYRIESSVAPAESPLIIPGLSPASEAISAPDCLHALARVSHGPPTSPRRGAGISG